MPTASCTPGQVPWIPQTRPSFTWSSQSVSHLSLSAEEWPPEGVRWVSKRKRRAMSSRSRAQGKPSFGVHPPAQPCPSTTPGRQRKGFVPSAPNKTRSCLAQSPKTGLSWYLSPPYCETSSSCCLFSFFFFFFLLLFPP